MPKSESAAKKSAKRKPALKKKDLLAQINNLTAQVNDLQTKVAALEQVGKPVPPVAEVEHKSPLKKQRRSHRPGGWRTA